jgi:hypothetical protein
MQNLIHAKGVRWRSGGSIRTLSGAVSDNPTGTSDLSFSPSG